MSIRPVELSREGSQQIEICRSLCIFFLVFVHLPPWGEVPDFFDVSAFRIVELIFNQFLGRASVPALSFASGFLLVMQLARAPAGRVAGRKLTRIYVPLLVWNLLWILAGIGGDLVKGDLGAVRAVFASLTPEIVLGRWLGITGEVVSIQLAFLRELLVAQLLIALALPAIARAPLVVAAVAVPALTLASIDEILAPVVIRSEVLLYVLVGACLALSGRSLTLFHDRRVLVAGAVTAFAMIGLMLALEPMTLVQDKVLEQVRRFAMAAIALYVAGALVGTAAGGWLARRADMIFLAFLSHMIVFWIGGSLFLAVAGSWTSPAYALFWAGMPVACVGVAAAIQAVLRLMPAAVQIAFAGKRQGLRQPR